MKTASEMLFEKCKIVGGDNPSPSGKDSIICVNAYDVITAMNEYAAQQNNEAVSHTKYLELREKIIKEVASYVCAYDKIAADMVLECIHSNL